ncbi:hypothetical protein FA95DRAFT_224046 [Auriscalpium vulgare]|uniref:Uncharacterized protein n=1 Tax=Auriscalpium vulgare TaxID=40419 RepID=A0ACB8RLG7_9AGAM|nr:hypothetical protein FA95DRAFT_224046 [Auriscalpium vulgare]
MYLCMCPDAYPHSMCPRDSLPQTLLKDLKPFLCATYSCKTRVCSTTIHALPLHIKNPYVRLPNSSTDDAAKLDGEDQDVGRLDRATCHPKAKLEIITWSSGSAERWEQCIQSSQTGRCASGICEVHFSPTRPRLAWPSNVRQASMPGALYLIEVWIERRRSHIFCPTKWYLCHTVV